MFKPNSYYHQSSRAATAVVQPHSIAAPFSKGYPKAASSYYDKLSKHNDAQHRSMGIKHPNGIYKIHQAHGKNGGQRNSYFLNRKGHTHKRNGNQHNMKTFHTINLSLVNTNKTHFLSQVNANNVAANEGNLNKFEEFNKTWKQRKEVDIINGLDDVIPNSVTNFNKQNKGEAVDNKIKRIQRINYEKLKKQLDDLEKLIETVDEEPQRNKTVVQEYFDENSLNKIKKRKINTVENYLKKIEFTDVSKTNGWNTIKEDQWMTNYKEVESRSVEKIPFVDVPKTTKWKAYKEDQLKKQQSDSEKILQNFNFLANKFPQNAEGKSKTTEISSAAKEIVDKTIHKVDLMDRKSLRVKQPGLVDLLYSGLQCSGCAERFAAKDTLRYSDHLDWHFRQNRRDKEATRKPQRRPWFYSNDDWMNSAELQDKEETETSNFFEKPKPVEESSAPAPPGHSYCALCGDEFQLFYHDDLEEWRCRNAVLQNGKTYHPDCFELSKVNKN